MRFAICDDNNEFVDKLYSDLVAYQVQNTLNFEINKYSSVEDLYADMKDISFDLVFLDIEFPKKSGIDLANSLRFSEDDFKTEIVFISGNTNYAMKLFSFKPFDFLEKPVDYKKLKAVLDLFFKLKNSNSQTFSYNKKNTTIIRPYKEIMYFMSSNRKIEIHTISESDSFYGKLDDIINDLKSNVFLRVNQSFIVNKYFIKKYSHKELIMKNDFLIPISNKYLGKFLMQFNEDLGE